MQMPASTKKKLAAVLVVWAVLLVAGMGLLQRYKSSASVAAAAPALWPVASGLQRDPALATLVLTIHPKCPCTRATLAELSRMIHVLDGRVKTFVLVARPEGVPSDWEKTDLVDTARSLPGVEVVIDEGSTHIKHFGSFTSGQALFYSREGALLFAGGLTPQRGHEGESVGKSTVLALAQGQTPLAATSKVFGCPLDNKSPSEFAVSSMNSPDNRSLR